MTTGVLFTTQLKSTDTQFGGSTTVSGVVSVYGVGTPLSRKVRLIDEATGKVVRQTWSDPTTGAYSFANVKAGPWTIIAYDYTGTYDAVVLSSVTGV